MKKILKRFAAALCTGLLMNTVTVFSAAAEETALPSGMTIEKIQRELNDKADELSFEGQIFASAAVGIFQGDEVLYSEFFGKTDIENNIPADENSVYEWGSISKTLIWVSAMQLWEQGLLDLDRDVREYLPDSFFQHLSYDEPITMLNLMNHNAGWQETTRPVWKTDENEILSLGEELQAIEPAQIYRPGEVTAYSNYGAAVAGYVIECVAGQDYCEYVHEHIFEPLGMEHTALNPTHSDNAWVQEKRRQMKSYRFPFGSCVDIGNCLNYISAYPAGAAAGTLADLMTYAQALVNDDAPLFQSPETQEIMFSGTDFYGDSDIPICAHGFWCNEYAVRTYGHTGATTAGQANMLFDIDSKTGLVVMVNEPDGNDFLSCTPALVFGELSPDKYISDKSENAELNGYYLPSRSTYRGMLKFIPYLSAISARNIGDIQNIGNNVYQISDQKSAVLLGAKTTSDGNVVIQQPSMDFLHDKFYIVKLCLFTFYVLSAVTTVYQMLIRHKLKKHGRQTAFHGSSVITAGHIARLVSVLVLLCTYVIYANYNGGIPVITGTVFGIMQMLCIAVCGISAITSCISVLLHKKEKMRYILNTIGCAIPITAILYFEMYHFWEC